MKKKKGFALLMEWAGRDRGFIYGAIALSLVASLCTVVPYYIFYQVIDSLMSGSCTAQKASGWAAAILGVMAVKELTGYFAILSSHKGAYNTLFRVRCMVTEHMSKMPLGALNERSTGEIKYVMNESIEKLELFLAHNLSELVLYLAGPIVVFIYLMSLSWVLGLVSLVPLVFVVLVMAKMYKRFSKLMPEINESNGALSGSVNEYVNGMRLIKAYRMGAASFKKYADGIETQHRLWVKITKATGPLYAAFVVLLECGAIILVPLSGYLYMTGHITAGVLMLFTFVGSRYLTDVRPLQEIANNLSFSMNGVNQVQDILDTPMFGSGKPFPARHDIEVRDVDFSYDGKNTVLEHCKLSISHGERMAVIGESGAGKTTLVELISRFYDVTGGSITIGGVDVREIDYEQLLENISVVFQQSFLTRGSVFENIAMGNSDATLAEVRQAARQAQVDDFIMSLPDGYDTLVGGYGSRFSGGQKQRICIARAILKNAPILVLDEATSAADPENQLEIDRAIANLCEGKTVIIVAHRLGIVQTCHRVAVVEHRTISHTADWETLLTENGYFKKVWNDYNKARNMRYQTKGVEAI